MSAKPINEGKTKIIWQYEAGCVVIESKNDLTAGNGRKHDIIVGKAELSTNTTCNVFHFLNMCGGIPLAFIKQISETEFMANKCEMIPLEVVIRREAHGSYLKRRPDLKKGHRFPRLVFELFLKTKSKKWQNHDLQSDDPLLVVTENGAELYLPDEPIFTQRPFLVLNDYPLKDNQDMLQYIEEIARKTFLLLERAWSNLGRKLVDFKLEFGLDQAGNLVIADVIDNDSWRVVDDGEYLDKQFYREDGDLDEVTRRYTQVMELTSKFSIPKQQLVLWKASESDNTDGFVKKLEEVQVDSLCNIKEITLSAHKTPQKCIDTLAQIEQEHSDAVIIAFVGKSNGLGPMLASSTTIPVITVPATATSFPDDIWSSLRVPSNCPVMTVLDQGNAVLAALSILATRNAGIYSRLQYAIEARIK